MSQVFRRLPVASVLRVVALSLLGGALPVAQLRGAEDPDFVAIEKATRPAKPFAYWPLRERNDKSTPDVVGGKFPAEFTTAAGPYVPDLRRSNFFGGRALAKLPELPDNYAVSVWFWNDMPNDAREITAYLISRGELGAANTPGDHWGIGGNFAARGKLIFYNGETRKTLLEGKTEIAPRTWNHVVFMREGKQVAAFLNGNAKPEITGEVERTFAAGEPQWVLGGRSDNMFGLHGRLAHVALFNRKLSPDEVAAIWKGGAVTPSAIAEGPAPEFPPLSPEESLRLTHLRDGFTMELMAAEPLVIDPVAIEWGPDGKLWVVEMADYPTGIDGRGKPGGRLRYLEDTDGDGKYDKSTLFMTGVNFPTGVLPWRSGVVVTAAPEIFYAADTNGDGKADYRETLYRGFAEGNTQLRVNGLQWGLDGWVYCANGWSGGVVTAVKSGTKVDIRGRDFRVRLDDNQLQAQSGVTEFGRNRDDWGNWFGCDNSHPLFHFVLAEEYIRRNPHAAPPDAKVQVIVPEAPKVFAVSPPEKRFHTFDHVERFTSACSTIIYRDDLLFGPDAPRHVFVCEPVHNLVHHSILTPQGSTFTASRAPEEQASEFIASEDRWFKPVMVRTGPDGALWVVDMYRYMVEHPDWLPPEGKAATAPFLRLGDDRGRIYRVYPKGKSPRTISKLHRLPPDKLVAALDSPSGWQRDTAQRLLVQRGQAQAVAPLVQMVEKHPRGLARLHALCMLGELDALPKPLLIKAMADSDAGVRRHAVRLAEGKADAEVIAAAAKLSRDADPQVRLQLAYTLGAWQGDQAAAALADFWAHGNSDPYLAAAILSSLRHDNIAAVVEAVLKSDVHDIPLEPLLAQAAALGQPKILVDALARTLNSEDPQHDTVKMQMLATTFDTIDRQKTTIDALASQSAAPDALKIKINDLVLRAAKIVGDNQAPAASRAAGLRLLARSGVSKQAELELISKLISPQSPSELQLAAIKHLATRAEPSIAPLLLAQWEQHAPRIRSEILDTLVRRASWSAALLDAIESGSIKAADVDTITRQRLNSWSDAALRTRAEKLLATSVSTDRQRVLAEYKPHLTNKGDRKRGATLFAMKCATCHRLGDVGRDVGPNLAAITDKSPIALITAILDPNQAVETRYLSYVAETTDGRVLSGVLSSETASGITLVGANGEPQFLLRADIEVLKASGKSLMPEGFETELSPQDIVDLIEFLR